MVKQGIPIVLLSLGLAATLAAQTTPTRGPNINDVMKKASAAQAPAAPPRYKYPVTPQAGPWLVCVQTFKGAQSQQLAEELAEVLSRDFKIPAYLYDSGYKQREEENARVEKLRQQYREAYIQMEKQGLQTVDGMRRWRVPEVNIEDEFAVLVGKSGRQLKDMEAARDYLDDIRKIKNLPTKFSPRILFDFDQKPVAAFANPFATSMVVRNPMVPLVREQDDPTKADKFLKEINSDEDYSLLKCRKAWTLVVKVYQAPSELLNREGPAMTPRFNPNKKEGESYLNIGALQAHKLAEFLRKTLKTEAYVLHHRYYSLVTIGQYDAPDDPQLLAHQKTFANMQLKTNTGEALETFSAQPLPMRIPK